MCVAKHTESDCGLIPVQQRSKPFLVLVAAFVGDVAEKHGVPTLLLKFCKILRDKLEVLIGVLELVPETLVVPVTALGVKGEDSRLQVG